MINIRAWASQLTNDPCVPRSAGVFAIAAFVMARAEDEVCGAALVYSHADVSQASGTPFDAVREAFIDLTEAKYLSVVEDDLDVANYPRPFVVALRTPRSKAVEALSTPLH
jgi:hypothetical protein